MSEAAILILLLVFLTIASAFFSGAEVALFSLSPMRVKAYRNDQDPKKRLIAQLLHEPRNLLVTVFMLNTLVNILLQNSASKLFGDEAGWGLKIGVPLFLTLFLGEIIPKNICMQNNVATSYLVATPIAFFHRHLAKVRKLAIAVTVPVSRLMFFYLKKEEKISEEELEHVLNTSEQSGVLHPDEASLVRGYLALQSSSVKEVMVPRGDILFYDIENPLTKLTYLFVEQECTRIPVCHKDLDKVLGVIDAKQFFLHGQKIQQGEDLKKLLTKPLYIPETTAAIKLLHQFEAANQVIALVVDEYGSVTGLVSREDLAEQVIGEIADLRDQKPLYTVAEEDEIICSGKLELSEFNKYFNVDLRSPNNMVTIGGWLMERIGTIPKGGESFEEENFLFQVLSAAPQKIRRIYVRRLSAARKVL